MGESNIVCDIFVGDDPLLNRFPHRHRNRRLALLLPDRGEERHRVVSVASEHRVGVLTGRVDENLGFCLGEFAEPDHTLTRRNLIPVQLAYLDCTEGKLSR